MQSLSKIYYEYRHSFVSDVFYYSRRKMIRSKDQTNTNLMKLQSDSKICIIRNTFGDRYPFLRLSLEYQEKAQCLYNTETFIFIDPHPQNGISSDYNNSFLNNYIKIEFENHKARYSWYLATKYMFNNYQYEYVLSIEDDIIISRDYLLMCDDIMKSKILEQENNVLYFHIGAWEKPHGDINKIISSGSSSRSILIHRSKFGIIENFININYKNQNNMKIGNDSILNSLLKEKNMRTIAPEYNRHGHFGIYGWSSSGVHADYDGQKSIFEEVIDSESLYETIKDACLDGSKLMHLNRNKNPRYFWDFDPNVQFEKLEYEI